MPESYEAVSRIQPKATIVLVGPWDGDGSMIFNIIGEAVVVSPPNDAPSYYIHIRIQSISTGCHDEEIIGILGQLPPSHPP